MSRDIHEVSRQVGEAKRAAHSSLGKLWEAVSRTKTVDERQLQNSQLNRCLSVVDLTALGVGSTLGAGIYILTGEVAKTQAGPSVVLSFLVAAVASLLAGICYAEFAARVPRAGSAYVYSYVSVGELWAFIIGWNMILENMIGAASVGKAWSQYFDSLINDTIRRSIEENVGSFHSPGLGEFPDFFACGLLLVSTFLVSLGVKMSSVLSFVFTVLNLIVILCIIVVGLWHAEPKNWTDEPGFFPFGFRGVLSGAATCFYAFVGFDTIATSGEEAREPSKSIPTAIVTTLLVCFLAYFGVSCTLTLLVPWHELQAEAALPKAFAQRGIPGAEYVIAVGGLCGLTAALMGSLFPLPRTVYAMATDGLLVRGVGHVWSATNTPFLATWICGATAAILGLLLDLDSLVQMMSIGTLMAYTMVAVSVLVLRYQRESVGLVPDVDGTPPGEDTGLLRVGDQLHKVTYTPSQATSVFTRVKSVDDNETKLENVVEEVRRPSPEDSTYKRASSNYSLSLFGQSDEEPSESSKTTAVLCLVVLMSVWSCMCLLTVYGEDYVVDGEWWAALFLSVGVAIMVACLIILIRQPMNKCDLHFKVPLVPLLPVLSVLINIYLMITLSQATWIRFVVWLVLGLLLYFGYGLQNSSERQEEDKQVILYDVAETPIR